MHSCNFHRVTLAALFLCMACFPASAKALPKNAVKLSESQVKALYSGHTAVFPVALEYFAPDGTLLHVKTDGTAYGEGNWKVNGDKVCTSVTLYRSSGEFKAKTGDCWEWAKSGKHYLSRWTGEGGASNRWHVDDASTLVKGDKVTARWKKVKAKAGK